MAAISNLYIDAGSTFSAIITVRDSSNTPIELSGYTVKSQIRKSYGSQVAYDFDATIFDTSTGKVKLELSASQSSDIKPGRYIYDVKIYKNGEAYRVVEGLVIITPESTKIENG